MPVQGPASRFDGFLLSELAAMKSMCAESFALGFVVWVGEVDAGDSRGHGPLRRPVESFGMYVVSGPLGLIALLPTPGAVVEFIGCEQSQ